MGSGPPSPPRPPWLRPPKRNKLAHDINLELGSGLELWLGIGLAHLAGFFIKFKNS